MQGAVFVKNTFYHRNRNFCIHCYTSFRKYCQIIHLCLSGGYRVVRPFVASDTDGANCILIKAPRGAVGDAVTEIDEDGDAHCFFPALVDDHKRYPARWIEKGDSQWLGIGLLAHIAADAHAAVRAVPTNGAGLTSIQSRIRLLAG